MTQPLDVNAFAREHHPFILAMWHGQFLLLPKVDRGGVPIRSMVGRHGDAEFIGQVLGQLGMEMIRGAGAGTRRRDRGGAYALRRALASLEEGFSVAMTADVPPGPARKAGIGIVTLAKMSGRPIVPVAVATSRYHAFRTWSRMTLNLPFGTLAVVAGDPIRVPADSDDETLERARLQVEQNMNEVTRLAYSRAGADPRRATPPNTALSAPIAGPGTSLKLYRLLTSLARPVAPAILRMRARRGKEDLARQPERMGHASVARPEGRLVWCHAASVGETNAVLPLLSALRVPQPELRFLLTTGTVTSAEIARKRLGERDIHQYAPLDSTEYVRRFLDHWRPDLAIFTESEIWPNLILESSTRGLPLALINARMSNGSFARWKRYRRMSEPLFNRFAIVLAQNERLARRFSALGARNALAVGNIKIDAPPPPMNPAEAERLSRALAGRSHLVAASTHEGEDETLGIAHRVLAKTMPGFCTIVVPRHPERGAEIAALFAGGGLTVARRSLGELPCQATDVYVADTLGELGTLYAVSPVAFIGGSLVDRGGQNPIEAIRHGAAVLTGPHVENFHDAYKALARHSGVRIVRSGEELARVACALLSDEGELQRMRAAADAALATLSGALQRTVAALLPLLSGGKDLTRASP